jgi:hypothetical protein
VDVTASGSQRKPRRVQLELIEAVPHEDAPV